MLIWSPALHVFVSYKMGTIMYEVNMHYSKNDCVSNEFVSHIKSYNVILEISV